MKQKINIITAVELTSAHAHTRDYLNQLANDFKTTSIIVD